jgi:Dyp-type peroxidase family
VTLRQQRLELGDIQALVLRGQVERPWASYLLLRITETSRTQAWLARLEAAASHANELADDDDVVGLRRYLDQAPALIATAHPGWRRESTVRSRGLRIALALSCSGLEALKAGPGAVRGLVPEFCQGMTHPHRRRVLRDVEGSAPEEWRWGGPHNPPVDVLCVVFAADPAELRPDALRAALGLGDAGLELVERVDAYLSDREPFGFRDGISQPRIEYEGMPPSPRMLGWTNSVPPGEFILGYRNGYGRLPLSPHVAPETDPEGHLPALPGGQGRRDLGRNGSYLVVRQLQQHVTEFEQFLRDCAEQARGDEHGRPELVGARMVGRWRSGAPLVTRPEYDDPTLGRENDFAYGAEDRSGGRCPLGAHVRRANPRDSLTDPAIGVDRAAAMRRTNLHRLIRRGRVYPAPPADASPQWAPEGETGLVFLAFNASIERQFEFVQQTWVNGTHFDGGRGEADPLLSGHLGDGRMTLPRETLRSRIEGLSRFVTVRGGAYFFMPGLRALHHLARR